MEPRSSAKTCKPAPPCSEWFDTTTIVSFWPGHASSPWEISSSAGLVFPAAYTLSR